MFAGMSSKQPRSNLPSATFALTKRDSTGASPIGQERRSSGNSALPVPDAASTSLWNNFPSSGASLFGNIMSGQVSAEQAIRRDVQAEQVPAGTSIASYMDAVHNSPAAIRHSAPSAPAFVSTGASTSYTSQQRGFPGSFQQQTMSMPFSGAPQQHQYPRQPQPQPHQTSAPTPNLFQGNPLNWLGTTAAAPMESQTDRSAYFQMPFNLEQEQPK